VRTSVRAADGAVAVVQAGDGNDRAGSAGPVGETVPAAADALAILVLAGADEYEGAGVHAAQMTIPATAHAAEVPALVAVSHMPA
jgi:hypothetical protein